MAIDEQAARHPLLGLVADLAATLREEVLPGLGDRAGREHAQSGASGDVTFAIDERAEARMEAFLAERAPEVAFYSEDRGIMLPERAGEGEPEWILIVDPIDGTRPAMAGLESACVSVAASRYRGGSPAMADVELGCVVEIKSGERFLAVRGGGVEPEPSLAAAADPTRMLWTYGLRGRPVVEVGIVLEELVNGSSVGGGTFDLGSAAFDMTRVLTGQMDAYIEPGPRMVGEIEGMRAEFERVGDGAVLNNSPYDLAAAVLILTEAGAVVTDASGRPLDDRLLLGSGAEYQMSCVAAANPQLHTRIIELLDAGMERLQAWWEGGGARG